MKNEIMETIVARRQYARHCYANCSWCTSARREERNQLSLDIRRRVDARANRCDSF